MFDRAQQAYHKKVDSVKGIDSWAAFQRAIETDETAHGRTEDRTIWKNEDLDLTPPKGWTWGWYDYAAFWWSYGKAPRLSPQRRRLVIEKSIDSEIQQASLLVSGVSEAPWWHWGSTHGKVCVFFFSVGLLQGQLAI